MLQVDKALQEVATASAQNCIYFLPRLPGIDLSLGTTQNYILKLQWIGQIQSNT